MVMRDTRVRRKLLLAIYSFLLMIALAAILSLSCLILLSKASLSDRLAEVADVIAAGTAILGVLAGLVALQAYAAAIGLPNLEIQVWFSTSAKNMPVFLAEEVSSGIFETTEPSRQTTAIISIRNKSVYSARDPVVIVKIAPILSNLNGELPLGDKWIPFQLPDESLGSREMVIQWDSEAGSIIHGHSLRRLPDMQLGTLSCYQSEQPLQMRVEIMADGGYRRHVDLRLFFSSDGVSQRNSHLSYEAAPEWL